MQEIARRRVIVLFSIAFGLALTALLATDRPVASAQAVSDIVRAACLGFAMQVTSGPNAGQTWTGDLLLDVDPTGFFDATLVPAGPANRAALERPDGPLGTTRRGEALCHGTGQLAGTMAAWTLTCGADRLTGFGHIDTQTTPDQEMRGLVTGPTANDFGVFHGSNYPPYIRTISPTRSDRPISQ